MSITVFILYVNDLQYAKGGCLQILKDIFMFQLIYLQCKMLKNVKLCNVTCLAYVKFV